MEKKWKLLSAPSEAVAALQTNLGIHPVICKILVQRGINTFNEAKAFFRPELSALHDPFLMKDMHKAVQRIVTALQNR